MSKWIAEFELEDGDKMPEHMDLEYKGVKIDFHCKPLEQEPCEDCISRQAVLEYIEGSEAELGHSSENELVCKDIKEFPPVTPEHYADVLDKIRAEIIELRSKQNVGVLECLDIIDKYKAESEG